MPKSENLRQKAEFTGSLSPNSIRDFVDLQVWQLARELRSLAYLYLQRFPLDERHALSAQIRRSAISATANIAEGFGRYSYQENIQFCRVARGSVYELRDHFITAADQGYISQEDHRKAELLAQRVIQTLNGYIRSTRARQAERKGSQS